LAIHLNPVVNFTRIMNLSRIGDSGETYAFDRQGLLITKSRFDDHLKLTGAISDNDISTLSIRITDPGGNTLEGHIPTQTMQNRPLTLMARRAISGNPKAYKKAYRDYRGVPVFGVWLWDKIFDIGITTEIDAKEALLPHQQIRIIIFIILFFNVFLSLGLVLLLVWFQEREKAVLQQHSDSLEAVVQKRTNDLERANNSLKEINLHLEDKVSKRTEQIKQEYQLRQKQEKFLLEEQQVASLGRMVSGVAHEINTPIGNAVTGISYIKHSIGEIEDEFKNKKLTESTMARFIGDAQDITKSLELSLKNAANLIKSFKSVAVEQTHEHLQTFILKEYLENTLRSMHNQLKKSNLEVNINCDNLMQIKSYPGYYSQIITNLVNNSLMHGFENGETGNIDIRIIKAHERLKITYKDTGKGITSENLKRIFDPFFSSKRGKGGTGQGLYIIARIIQTKLNGSIECFSEQNKGVCFEIDLQADFEDFTNEN